MSFILNCLGLLPFISLGLTILCLHCRDTEKTLFHAIAAGSLLWSLFIVFETNLLSAFGLISQG